MGYRLIYVDPVPSIVLSFRVTDFYYSYISSHVFRVVFPRTDVAMMFALHTSIRLHVSPFKILKIM